MIIVDASVAVKWYAPEPGHHEALQLINDHDVLIAPDLIAYELLNALRQKMKRQEITAEQFQKAPELLSKAVKQFVPASSLATVAAALSLALDHPVYDCAYVACAIKESGTLLTADARLILKMTDKGFGHLARLLDSIVVAPTS